MRSSPPPGVGTLLKTATNGVAARNLYIFRSHSGSQEVASVASRLVFLPGFDDEAVAEPRPWLIEVGGRSDKEGGIRCDAELPILLDANDENGELSGESEPRRRLLFGGGGTEPGELG